MHSSLNDIPFLKQLIRYVSKSFRRTNSSCRRKPLISRRRDLSIAALVESLEIRRMLSGQAITVTTFSDAVTHTGESLRDAITQANVDTGNSDTITFNSSLFANNTAGMINLAQGVMKITNSMTITGAGANLLTINAGGNSQIFNVDNGSPTVMAQVSITGMTLTNGSASVDNQEDEGGAIYNAEDLTLSGDVISGAVGAGVRNSGTLKSTDDAFTGNSADVAGGGILSDGGSVISTDDAFTDNSAGFGGGIAVGSGSLTATGDTFAGNSAAEGYGGGIEIGENTRTCTLGGDAFTGNSAADGGGVFVWATLASNNSTFSNNSATNGGGGVYVLGTLTRTTILFRTIPRRGMVVPLLPPQ